jgi:hypothetical protein
MSNGKLFRIEVSYIDEYNRFVKFLFWLFNENPWADRGIYRERSVAEEIAAHLRDKDAQDKRELAEKVAEEGGEWVDVTGT